jgi:hypothetical protein
MGAGSVVAPELAAIRHAMSAGRRQIQSNDRQEG